MFKPLKDGFGHSYLLLKKSGMETTNKGESLYFKDEIAVRNFLKRLHAPTSYWRRMALDIDLPLDGPAGSLEKVIARRVIAGQLAIVDVSQLIELNRQPLAVTSKMETNKSVKFLPAQSKALSFSSEQPKVFTSLADAQKYLQCFAVSDEYMHEVATLSAPSAGNSLMAQRSVSDQVAQHLFNGDILAVEQTRSVTPPSSQQSAENTRITPAAGGVGNRVASLGPHDDGTATAATLVQEDPVCTLTQFELKCSHDDRSYSLDCINGLPELNGSMGMQVISSPKKLDKLTIKHSGSCVNGHSDCPIVRISRSGSAEEETTAAAHTIEVEPKKREYHKESFSTFYRKFLLPDLASAFDYETYTIETCGCEADQQHSATVHVFPNFKWSGKIGVGYSDISKKSDTPAKHGWNINGELALEMGWDEWTYKPKVDFTAASLFPKIHDVLGGLFDKIGDMTGDHSKQLQVATGGKSTNDNKLINFKFTPPNVSLGGSLELKEVKSSYDVDFEGKIALEMAPLVKAELTTDIFDWLIIFASSAAAGPAGKTFGDFLVRVKRWSAKRGMVVQAIFDITGGVDAKLEWQKEAGKPWQAGDAGSELQSALTMGLAAKVAVEKTVWKLECKAGAELYVKGAKDHKEGIGLIAKLATTTRDDKPALDGTLTFTGISIYYAYYAEIGAKSASSDEMDTAKGRRSAEFEEDAPSDSHEVARKKEKVERLWDLMANKVWFEDDGAVSLPSASL